MANELPKGEDAESTEGKKKKRFSFKFIMLLLSLIILLAAIGGGGYWWLYLRPNATGLAGLFGSSETTEIAEGSENVGSGEAGEGEVMAQMIASKHSERTAGAESEDGPPTGKLKPGIRPISLPSLTINLSDQGGNKYLRLGMDVEVNSTAAVQRIKDSEAKIRDAIILLLSSKTTEDLSSAEGKIILKNEIAGRLNQILSSQNIVQIYFTDFVIQ